MLLSSCEHAADGREESVPANHPGSIESDRSKIRSQNWCRLIILACTILSAARPASGQTNVVAWGDSSWGQCAVPASVTNALAIAGRGYHSLALQMDGTVAAWGETYEGSAGLTNIVAISAGEYHLLALRDDRTVVAYGIGSFGQCSVPADLSNVTAVTAGRYHSLALRADGTLAAWGQNSYGQCSIPTGLSNAVALAGGAYHSVALRVDGTVAAWGWNFEGQCTLANGLSNIVAVASGDYHSLALRADGTVVAWGDNGYGQCSVPAGLSNVATIVAGAGHSMALKADGTVVAWGSSAFGQCLIPAGLSNVAAIAAGKYHDMAMVGVGAIHLPPTVEHVTVVADTPFYLRQPAVGAGPVFLQWQENGVDLPGQTSQVLSVSGINLAREYRLVAANAFGVVTGGAIRVETIPLRIAAQPQGATCLAGTAFTLSVGVESGILFSCQWFKNGTALPGATASNLTLSSLTFSDTGDYSVLVSNQYGSITSSVAAVNVVNVAAWGQGTSGQTSIPAGLSNAVTIAGGTAHSLALRADGTVAVWGSNSSGQTSVPAGLSSVVGVAAGGNHSLALRSNGTVVAWGRTNENQCAVPLGLGRVAAVAAGKSHSLALRVDGTVAAWGYNGYGQCSVPTGLSNVVAIAGGYCHTLALRADGTVAAWGYNGYGQCSVPAGLSNVVAIAGGYYHTLALRADGTVAAWGYNSSGQCGIPAGLSNVVAIAAGDYHSLALRADGTMTVWGSNTYGQRTVPAGLSNVVAIAGGGYHSLAVVGVGRPFVPPSVEAVDVIAEQPFCLRQPAAGALPLTWQWVTNGVPLAGATNQVLSVSGITAPHVYRASVSNSLGAATGTAIQVSVVPLRISDHPATTNVLAGSAFSFAAAVQSVQPVLYQWLKNGSNIEGAAQSNLAFAVLAPSDAGDYQVIVSNSYGAVTSRTATLTVSALQFTAQPAFGVYLPGTTGVLTCAVAGVGPVTYNWFKDGSWLSGAASSNLPLPDLQFSHAGVYVVTASNEYGSIASTGAEIRVVNVAMWGSSSYLLRAVPAGLSNAVAIASGGNHMLALRSDGTVVAWGNGGGGQLNVPAGLSNVVAIAAGQDHGLAVRADGVVAAWGWNANGQTAVPADLTNAVAVAGGGSHALALRDDGTVVAWGDNTRGQCAIAAGLSNVTAIAAGTSHSLALQLDGTVAVWGDNASGQCAVPAGLDKVVTVAAGDGHSLALQSDGTVVAWGSNGSGQCTVPAGLSNVIAIAGGGNHSLALQADGAVVAWGHNGSGQSSVPVGLSKIVAVTGGDAHSAALVGTGSPFVSPAVRRVTTISGLPFCLHRPAAGAWPLTWQWQRDGTNVVGATEAGLASSGIEAVAEYRAIVSNFAGTATSAITRLTVEPLRIVVQPQVDQMLAGLPATVSVTVQSAVPVSYQWYRNGVPLVGATNPTVAFTALLPSDTGTYHVEVSNVFGGVASAPLSITPLSIRAWGDKDRGQCTVPTSLSDAVAVAARGNHSLALRRDGTVAAWGNNSGGQCTVPVGLRHVVAVSAGGSHSLALRADGVPIVWGGYGADEYDVPTDLCDAVAVAAGESHSLALRVNGTVTAWGYNGDGQCTVPLGLSNVVAVASGGHHSLALRADGTVIAWGYNAFAQCSVTPGLSNIIAIAAGRDHSLGLRANGTVTAWGYNGDGQCTVPPGLSNVVAIASGGNHSLALRADGTVAAWGYDFYDSCVIPAGLSNVVAIAGGANHSVALLGVGRPFLAPEVQRIGAVFGQPFFLRQAAAGVWPLTWQWQQNGGDVPCATGAVLGVSGITTAAEYRAIVSNAAGAATGTTTLVSLIPLQIVTQPQGLTCLAASDATFSVEAIGATPLTFRWRKDGVALAETTEPSLAITNLTLADAGDYEAVVSNAYAAVTSVTARLEVLPLRMTLDPQGGNYPAGTEAVLSAGVESVVPPSWQWLKDGMAIGGATSSNLVLGALTFGDTGGYQVVASNAFGAATSGVATVTVGPFVITSQPADLNVTLGLTGQLTVAASSTVPLSYQWYRNRQPIAGAVTSSLSIAPAQLGDAGLYHCVLDNVFGPGFSATARVSVLNVAAAGDVKNIPASASNIVAISGGEVHSLALTAQGEVLAWGRYNYSSQQSVPVGLGPVIAVAAGRRHSLALRANGTVAAWGETYYGQCNVPPGLSDVVAIAAGGYFSLALRSDGKVVAWGYNGSGQTNVSSDLAHVVAISAGESHALALRADGTVIGWGSNSSGQRSVPTGVSNVVAIAAGRSHSLALLADRTVVAWGDNQGGQCTVPTGLSDVVAIAAGQGHSVALRADGCVITWGQNYVGQQNLPTGLPPVSGIAAGYNHTMLLIGVGAPHPAPHVRETAVPVDAALILPMRVVGAHPTAVQWQRNGTNVPGMTGLALIEALATSSCPYRAVFSNAEGAATSAVIQVRVEPALFTLSPTDVTVLAGSNAAFAVRVSALDPVVFQWLKDGAPWPGATSSNLVFGNVQGADGGLYSVVASNRYGASTSDVARLTVLPLLFTTQPSSQTVPLSGTAAFSVGVTGLGPISFRWYRDGGLLPGVDGETLAFNVSQLADAGLYWTVASNQHGAVTSQPARLTVTGIGFSNLTSDIVILQGRSTNHYVEVSAEAPVALQWLHDGIPIAGAVSPGLALNRVGSADIGNYQLRAECPSNVATSEARRLDVVNVEAWGVSTAGLFDCRAIPAQASNTVAVAGGARHALALGADGRIAGWGEDSSARTAPADVTNALAIAAGAAHSLALLPSGRVRAWGDNTYGQCIVPLEAHDCVAVAAGRSHSLALRADGRIVAWGRNTEHQCDVPAALGTAIGIAAGDNHSVALLADGTVAAWGDNLDGQCAVPAGLTGVIAVAAGAFHSLALEADGAVTSWGWNGEGQCAVPPGLRPVVAIAARDHHSLALQDNGVIVAWGANTYGQTAVPADLTNAVAIAAGYGHSLAIVSTGLPVFCAAAGELAIGPDAPLVLPARVIGRPPLRLQWQINGLNIPYATNAVLVGGGAAVDGECRVVASNQFGAVTGGVIRVARRPLIFASPPIGGLFAAGSNVVLNVAAEGQEPLSYQWLKDGAPLPDARSNVWALASVALSDAGAYQVIVSNVFGSVTSTPAVVEVRPLLMSESRPADAMSYLGGTVAHAVTVTSSVPFAVQWYKDGLVAAGRTNVSWSLTNLQFADAGSYFAMVSNQYGMVTSRSAQLSVNNYARWNPWNALTAGGSAATTAVAVANGWAFDLVLLADGTLLSTGSNPRLAGGVPAEAQHAASVAAGYDHAMTLLTDGTVMAWGDNLYGQCAVPPGLSNVTAIAAAGYRSLARLADGSCVLWGDNRRGQSLLPWDAGELREVAIGPLHSLGLRMDGTVAGWGADSYGECRAPSYLSDIVGLAAGYSYFSAALTRNGVLSVWGQSPIGLAASGGLRITQVTAGAQLLVSRQSDGTVVQWRSSLVGSWSPTPAPPMTNITDLAPVFFDTPLAVIGWGAPQIAPAVGRVASREGARLHLQRHVMGLPPLSFQWQVDGVAIAGATNAALWLPLAQAGLYRLVVSNALGVATSGTTQVELDALRFESQPQDRWIVSGQTNVLSVMAKSSVPVSYGWLHNGQSVPGATDSTFLLTGWLRSEGGGFAAVASNAYGAVTSRAAQVSVKVPQGLTLEWTDAGPRVRFRDWDGSAMTPALAPLFEVWSTGDLGSDTWQRLPGTASELDGWLYMDDPSATNAPSRFYHVRER